jgi:signal transduction histidine kinase
VGTIRATTRSFQRSPLAVDITLSVVLAVLLVLGSIGESYPSEAHDQTASGQPVPQAPAIAYGLVVLACLVYIWRRRWPVGTLAVSLAAVLIYTGLGYVNGSILVAPMIGIYHTATRIPARPAIAVAVASTVVMMAFSAGFGAFGLSGGPISVIPFEAAAALLLGLAVANRKAYIASVEDRAERAERTREQEARRRVDAERLRIARELHDVVAHNISMINVQARAAAAVIPDPPPAGVQALAAIKDASAEALRELRGILGVLRQTDDEEPTAPAPRLDQLDSLVSATTSAGLPTTVAVTGEPYPLPATVDLAAYRIVQESLTNALRYAGPAAAVVSVGYRPDCVVIEINDDGVGLGHNAAHAAGGSGKGGAGNPTGDGAPPPVGDGTGLGLIGMRERARAVGGKVQAGPAPDGGFRVLASLPAGRPL